MRKEGLVYDISTFLIKLTAKEYTSKQDKYTVRPVWLYLSQQLCKSINTFWIKIFSGRKVFDKKTTQVYHGQWTSNLSQQQQQKFWLRMIFEQQNQKHFPEKFFFQKKFGKILEKKFKHFFFQL